MDLLLYECNGIQHYTTIRNFSRLVWSQLSNHNGATYFCKKCLLATRLQSCYVAHTTDFCHVQRSKFPKDPRCRFTKVQKQLPTPFVVYADFESILQPVNEDVDVTQGVYIAYKVVSSVDPDLSRPLVMYRGEDAAEMFVRKLQLEAEQLFDEYIATPKPMLFTTTEPHSFTTATTCHVCSNPREDDKVRDHCHITRNYRGAAHNACN